MEIKRSKQNANGTEEYRWHYDRTTCTGIYTVIVFLAMFYAAHLLFHFAFYSSPLWFLLFCNIISFKSLLLILCVYLASFFIYKPHRCDNGKPPWYPLCFKRSKVWEWAKFYDDWLTIRRGSEDLYKGKQFLYCVQPHGVLCYNRMEMMGPVWLDEVQPQTFGFFAAATPQFYTPGLRETALWAPAVDASKRVLNIVLRCGQSIYLWVGGTKELLTTDSTSTDTKMVILERYGFVKLAIVHGVDIVPVMQFGEKWIYRMFTAPKWLGAILYRIYIPGMVFFGKFLLIPHTKRKNGTPIRMGMVIGEPIKVTKVDKEKIDFEKHIKPIHEEYMKRMRYLFDTYKNEFHYGDDETLTFVSAK
eukprot:1044573_1